MGRCCGASPSRRYINTVHKMLWAPLFILLFVQLFGAARAYLRQPLTTLAGRQGRKSLLFDTTPASTRLGSSAPPVDAPPQALFPAKVDSFPERGAIMLLSWILSRRYFLTTNALQLEARKLLSWRMSFGDFAGITKLLLRRSNGSVAELQTKIVSLLSFFVPARVKDFFRVEYAKNARLICEQSSEWIQSFGLIAWLIGSETSRYMVQVGPDEQWESGLHVKQCRYFLESGCKNTCVNICKIPTQRFFNEVVGLPLTMDPDYSDGSCKVSHHQATYTTK